MKIRTAHLTIEEITAYCDRTLAPASALEISDHLVACVECRESMSRAGAGRAQSPVSRVEYEELAGYIDNELGPIERHDVLEKLSRSALARRELRDLVEFKEEMAEAEKESTGGFHKWVLPIAAGIMIAAVAGWWISATKRHDLARDLTPELRATLHEVMAQGHFILPPVVEQLRLEREQLAGQSPAARIGLKLISPVGTAIATETPVFRWTQVEGATGYRISLAVRGKESPTRVFDVPSNQTTWEISMPLAPEQTYEWEVQAIRNGEMLEQAPVPPEPEAIFYVLDRQQQIDLSKQREKLSRSHLALGLTYARAGLIDDARDEFRALEKEDFALARKLIEALGNSRAK
jgi:hypothetical protein